jgi:hypothetical protein
VTTMKCIRKMYLGKQHLVWPWCSVSRKCIEISKTWNKHGVRSHIKQEIEF